MWYTDHFPLRGYAILHKHLPESGLCDGLGGRVGMFLFNKHYSKQAKHCVYTQNGHASGEYTVKGLNIVVPGMLLGNYTLSTLCM